MNTDTTILCLVIGHEDGHLTAWNSANDDGLQISVGDKIELLIDNPDNPDDSFIAPAEVSYLSAAEDGDAFAILYTYEEDTPQEMEEALEAAGWDAADDELLANVETILNSTSSVARTHWMYLVVGDYTDAENMRIWKRVLEPESPEVPFFGERFYTQLFFSDVPDGEFSVIEDSSSDDHRAASRLYVDELVDLEAGGDLEHGFPCVVFQVGKIDYGHAQISLYTKNIAPFDDFSLAADGWEAVTRDELDPVKEQIPERIELACRTRIHLRKPDAEEGREEGVMEITDYEITDPETVEESQYWLLPDYLIDHVLMQKEIANLAQELDSGEEGNDRRA